MSADSTPAEDLIVQSDRDGVRTLRMNMPRKLNGWTQPMITRVKGALAAAAADAAVQVVILTGTDPYYSAGVNLGGTIKLAPPKQLHAMIVEHNQALFDAFIDFPKPILAAVNGPAIGATVTTATLCDAIIASQKATFSTPFARLGVAREGCSSVLFAKIMGHENAERMLGGEGWAPTGEEAAAIGLAEMCVPHDDLLERAQAVAEGWIEAGRTRQHRGEMSQAELKAVNARESVEVADSFLSRSFLEGQFKFLWGKKKRGPALMFKALGVTRPVWSRFL